MLIFNFFAISIPFIGIPFVNSIIDKIGDNIIFFADGTDEDIDCGIECNADEQETEKN